MFRWSGDPESKFYRPTLDRSPPLRFRSHRNPREEFCHRPHSLWCRGTVISNLKETDEYGIGRWVVYKRLFNLLVLGRSNRGPWFSLPCLRGCIDTFLPRTRGSLSHVWSTTRQMGAPTTPSVLQPEDLVTRGPTTSSRLQTPYPSTLVARTFSHSPNLCLSLQGVSPFTRRLHGCDLHKGRASLVSLLSKAVFSVVTFIGTTPSPLPVPGRPSPTPVCRATTSRPFGAFRTVVPSHSMSATHSPYLWDRRHLFLATLLEPYF